jgi:hypothetical protein
MEAVIYSLDATLAEYAASAVAIFFMVMLALSVSDTIRGFFDIFDASVFRRLIHSVFGPCRFSLKFVLILGGVLPPLLALMVKIFWSTNTEAVETLSSFALFVGVVGPLTYLCVQDSFGPGPREQWRKHLGD